MFCKKIARLSLATLAVSLGTTGLYAGKMEQQLGQCEQVTHLPVQNDCVPRLSFREVQREATYHLRKNGHITKEVTTTFSGKQARQIDLCLPAIDERQDAKLCPATPCDQKQSKSQQCDVVRTGALDEMTTGQSRQVSYDGTAYSEGTYVEYVKQKCNFDGYERGLKVSLSCQNSVSPDEFFGDVSRDSQNLMITPITDDEIMSSLQRLLSDLRANGGTVTYRSKGMIGQACDSAQGQAQAQAQAPVQAAEQVQKVAPPVARKGK